MKHEHCLTHYTNEYNYYLLQRKNQNDSEYDIRETVIENYKDLVDDGEFECPKCKFECNDKDEMIQHEESCLGIKLNKVESVYKCIVCEDCGFTVQLKGQKMKPKYMMNAHKKKCGDKIIKKRVKFIKESLNNLDKSVINDIFKMISN